MFRQLASSSLAALLIAGPAMADVSIQYNGSTSYNYNVSFMPDFDQRRSGLPSNGSAYCVPTAALNLTAFLARHGYPGTFPGEQSYWYWASQANVPEVTTHDLIMGIAMATNASDGTTSSGAVLGLAIADVDMYHGFVVINQNGTYRHFDDIADWALGGGLVLPSIGWYVDFGAVSIRSGGHRVTLSNIQRSGGLRSMSVRDPASDEGSEDPNRLFTQSPFMSNSTGVVADTLDLCCTNTVTMDRLLDYTTDDVTAYLGGFVAVYPVSGLSASPDGGINFFIPSPFLWQVAETTTEVVLAGAIQDIAFGPNSINPYVITDTEVAQVNQFTGDMVIGVQDISITDVAFGRDPRLYLLEAGDLLRCLGLGTWEEEGRIPIPPCDRLVYSDQFDQVVGISKEGYLVLAPKLLNGDPIQVPIPGVLLGNEIYADISPFDGRLWLTSDYSPGFYAIRFDNPDDLIITQMPAFEFGAAPFEMRHNGHLLINAVGTLKEFKDNGGGEWDAVESEMSGREVDEMFTLLRSRSDYDPAIHDTEEYRNVLPETIPGGTFDCAGDVNTDNVIDVLDLLAVIAAWGTANIDADQAPQGGDGIIDVLDILAVLASWGDCPTP